MTDVWSSIEFNLDVDATVRNNVRCAGLAGLDVAGVPS